MSYSAPVELDPSAKMAHVIDFRSDTVTKPTESMKEAMVKAAVGDDVYGEDPTVNALENKIADMLGKESALFVPSGTMANLIAIMVHCNKRGSEAFVGELSHIYRYEQGGAAHVGGVLLSTLANKPDGTFDLNELERRIRGTDVHEPVTSLVAVENTHNVCGGKALPLKFLDELSEVCKRHNLPIHMDGARLFNACVLLRTPASKVVKHCDSVSVCFSKGLGAPVGSALVGSKSFVQQARRVRKMLGGGMRQAGVLAAAAIVALDEAETNLTRDHKEARKIRKLINSLELKAFTADGQGQFTNMILVRIPDNLNITAPQAVARLAKVTSDELQGGCKTEMGEGIIVKAIYFDNKTIRLTMHRDITDLDLQLAAKKITYVFKEMNDSAKTLAPKDSCTNCGNTPKKLKTGEGDEI